MNLHNSSKLLLLNNFIADNNTRPKRQTTRSNATINNRAVKLTH